jgi:hypothetical protein
MENINKCKICKSCGMPIENETQGVFCFYCHYRGTRGATRFLICKALYDDMDKWLDIDEICKEVSKLKKSKPDKSYINKVLARYTKSYNYEGEEAWERLILKRKRRVANRTRGKPRYEYTLGSKMIKRTEKMEKRWKHGQTLMFKPKVKFGKDWRKRAKAIRNRIRTGEIGLYEFLGK